VASRDGKRVFVVGDLRRGELSRYDRKTDRWLSYLPGLSAETLAFSRDGRFMTYVSIPEETLWKSKIDGTERQQLTFRPMAVTRPQWSPDGKEIAFTGATPGGRVTIYSIPAEGGIPHDLVPNFPNPGDLSWSPDGRSLIFGTFPHNKRQEDEAAVYLLDLETRKFSKIPGSDGYWSPHWSPDGRYVHALTLSANKLVIFDFQTQKWAVLTDFPVKHHESTRDGEYIYFESIFVQDPAILRVRAGDTAVEKVVSVRDLRRTSNLFMSWAGLTLDDSPLIALDAGSQEIYALDWEAP
jgi:Tol biopolymer transport system component